MAAATECPAAVLASADSTGPRRTGGRPTRAAAAERDERLLAIATRMFMDQGFEATSMDRLAEAAAVGKATLYGRYPDKAALFAAVLRRRILQVYTPLEAEVSAYADLETDLAGSLRRVARHLLAHGWSPDSLALSRILAAQSGRFPELGQLAVREGTTRQVRLVAAILARFADSHRYRLSDLDLAAELFLGITLGRFFKTALFGVPVDLAEADRRVDAAVDIFLNGFFEHA